MARTQLRWQREPGSVAVNSSGVAITKDYVRFPYGVDRMIIVSDTDAYFTYNFQNVDPGAAAPLAITVLAAAAVPGSPITAGTRFLAAGVSQIIECHDSFNQVAFKTDVACALFIEYGTAGYPQD